MTTPRITDSLAPLVLDLLEWVASMPRSYDETMEIWRTSCPRLPVWEEAIDRGYLVRCREDDGRATVEVTIAGHDFLAHARRRDRLQAAPADRGVHAAGSDSRRSTD